MEFEHGINNTIKRLRRTLGDSAEEPRYIETIPRRGYRLMVPVEWIAAADDSSSEMENEVSPGVGAAVRMPPDQGALTGRTVSHYRVLDIIGGGGMGVVYRAEDLKLGRQVALKFLPEELGSDPQALERFSREARAASSLDHPNICAIHEFGEHEGRPFIVMQLLEGHTLRDRLGGKRGPALPLQELLDIGIQVSDGLQAAHEKGIIHRDIKPANIFLTNKGVVKILDFGLAKLLANEEIVENAHPSKIGLGGAPALGNERAAGTPLELSSRAEPPALGGRVEGPAVVGALENADPSTPCPPGRKNAAGKAGGHSAQDDSGKVADATLTRTGAAMCTAGYMSPEQVRGEKLDARTDLFSFGLVLYEMATGQRAFTGETAAVVHDVILNNSPVPVRKLNSTLPAKLFTTIDKALEKDRERRYQSAAEMREDLEQLNAKRSLYVPARWRWYAAGALLIAIVVVGALYSLSRRKIKLTDKDTIVLSHFVNVTGDPVIEDALDWPLNRELQESPYLAVLYPSKVLDTLRLLKISSVSYMYGGAKLTPELAREVCLRSDSRAFVTASIASAGNYYQIALNALDCHSGRVLAKVEMETNARNQIVKTLGTAGHQLRRDLGEPEDSLRRFNTPLEEETSWSLEALQAFSQALRLRAEQGDAAAIPQLKRTVQLDPNLAMAYLNFAFIYFDEATRYATTAFNLRGRLSQRSRWFVEAVYYSVTGDLEKATATYVQWLQTFPGDPYPHQNFSVSLSNFGQNNRAAVEAREAVRLTPNIQSYNILMMPFIRMNRLEEARAVFEEAKARGIDDRSLRIDRYVVAFLQHDSAGMQEQLSWAMARPEAKEWAVQQQGDTAAYHGRLRAALGFYSAMRSYSPNSAATLANTALWDAETGDPARARQAAEKALAAAPTSSVRRVLAIVFARAGAVNQAEKLVKLIDQESSLNTFVQQYELPAIRAAIELEKNRPARAIEILQSALPYDLAIPQDSFTRLYPTYVRGLAYLKLGKGREAVTEFQKMVDHTGIMEDHVTAPLSHLQLGRAQVMMGDKAAARKSYQDFLTLWKDADPDIPIYQQAKAEYAKLK